MRRTAGLGVRSLGPLLTVSFARRSVEPVAVNKQVNDKERVAAALENPNLLSIVEQCIREGEDY